MFLWMAATLIAFFIKGLCGFANTLVFSTILSFGNTNIAISPVELVLGYPTNFILTYQQRKNLKPGICIPLSALVLLGSLAGALLLKNVDVTYVKVAFGIVIVVTAVEMFFREYQKKHTESSKILLWAIGIFSGILCGLFGIGALLAAYIGRTASNSNEFKANICAVFIIENTFRIVLYTVLGIITLSTLRRAVLLVPFMLAGLFLGIKSGTMIEEKLVKKIVLVLLFVSGVMLVLTGIL